jgi:uncharacterized repeat protein (TIGR01451 family)
VPSAAGSLTDTASVASGVPDPDTTNNSASVTVTVIHQPGPEADLSLTLTAAPDPVVVGQTLTYTLNVANAGPSDATGVVLTDVLPAGVSLVSAQASQGSCGGTATVSCSLGTVAVGGNAAVVIQVTANAAGTLTDTASVTSDVDDPDTTNNNASVTVTATSVPGEEADLTLALVADPHPVLVGQTLTYTLDVSNNGPSDAVGVTLTDVLPAGVSLVSVEASQGSCAGSTTGTATISCFLDTVTVGNSAEVVIQVIPSQAGSLTDTASVSSAVDDPDTSNNNAAVTVIVYTGQEPQADLSITKRASASRVEVGAQLTYTLTVANAGPDDATGVVVTDPLPAGLLLLSVAATQGDCTGTGTIVCNLGTIANGASAEVTLTVQAQQTGTIDNQATVTADTADMNDSNNSDDTAITVSPGAFR